MSKTQLEQELKHLKITHEIEVTHLNEMLVIQKEHTENIKDMFLEHLDNC